MTFAAKVWKVLVGIKDGLALLLLLLFFALLYTALTFRPDAGAVREGALLIDLDGAVVEEKSKIDPAALLLGGQPAQKEFLARDLVHALETAAADGRVKAVVLDLESFAGGGQVTLGAVGSAIDTVRKAGKPVLTRAAFYTDDGLQLAAHASEVWVDPLGGAIAVGPGGSNLYFKTLLDRLKVTAHVYKVGTYKAAVEPFTRTDASPEAEENISAVYAARWDQWQDGLRRVRPKADLTLATRDPAAWLAASGGDAARAAKDAGLVDQIGDEIAFGKRVAALVGAPEAMPPGSFEHTELDAWLAAKPPEKPGRAIAVVTIAGEIVDGEAGPGVAGGDRIARLLNEADTDDYAALVVRVNSPGGSVFASERIRAAIARWRAANKPVAVSMGDLAASGGYWVATPAQRIFADPATITGSIGVFGVVPTFENTLADVGVTTDGFRTTPLSGQPDFAGGLTPEVDALVQGNIEHTYARFLALVAEARGKTPPEIDRIAQGRVWDGGTARQLGLVDQLGGTDDALAWVAKAAKLEDGKWHADYLGSPEDPFASLIFAILGKGAAPAAAADLTGVIAGRQQVLVERAAQQLSMLLGGRGVQAYCLECAGLGTAAAGPASDAGAGWLRWLARLVS